MAVSLAAASRLPGCEDQSSPCTYIFFCVLNNVFILLFRPARPPPSPGLSERLPVCPAPARDTTLVSGLCQLVRSLQSVTCHPSKPADSLYLSPGPLSAWGLEAEPHLSQCVFRVQGPHSSPTLQLLPVLPFPTMPPPPSGAPWGQGSEIFSAWGPRPRHLLQPESQPAPLTGRSCAPMRPLSLSFPFSLRQHFQASLVGIFRCCGPGTSRVLPE